MSCFDVVLLHILILPLLKRVGWRIMKQSATDEAQQHGAQDASFCIFCFRLRTPLQRGRCGGLESIQYDETVYITDLVVSSSMESYSGSTSLRHGKLSRRPCL
jgi:hypothetical protein